jgi:beta-glucanase (GH16 family)
MKSTWWSLALSLMCSSFFFSVNAAPPEGYKLVWQDEFDGTKLDAAKWGMQIGPRHDAINSSNAVQVKDGRLTLTSYTEDGKHFTGFLWSKGKYEPTYGYFEARIRFHTTPGQWAAFWLQTPTMGNPLHDAAKAGTEIDIVEHRAVDQKGKSIENMYVMNLHWDGYGQNHKHAGSQGAPKAGDAPLQDNWHDYALLWTPQEYVFYLDGVEQWRSKEAVSQRSEYLLLSCEIRAKGWAGSVPTNGFGSLVKSQTEMEVDWVRVYQMPGQAAGK